MVFANGDSRSFSDDALPCLVELCDSWRLEGDALATALSNSPSDALLNYLLECGCIYVE